MEEFIASLTQFFTDWGYVGLFLSAFVAGSILPFSSEVVLVILVRMGLDPLLCLFAAASGNTLGGMTCYWIGHLGKRDWITRYLRVEPAKIDRVSRFLEGKGALFAFFTFLPYVGEAVAIVLGLSHINISLIFNSLISQCNPGVSEYLFNIDLIEFSTLRRRLGPLQYIINNQKLTLLL